MQGAKLQRHLDLLLFIFKYLKVKILYNNSTKSLIYTREIFSR